MQFLVKNGASTKNTPNNSMDSFLLAINTSYIDGIEVNLNLTKDGNIIIYHSDSIMNHPKHKFIDLTMEDIKKYNLGTKVKKHDIIKLEQLLKVFSNSSKLLILNLENHGNYNKQFLDKFISIISNYNSKNIYIKSSCKETILYIRDKVDNVNIGATIENKEDYFWDLKLNFYSVSWKDVLENDTIKKHFNNNYFFILTNIDNINDYNSIKLLLDNDIINKSFIITSNEDNFIKYI